MLGSGGQRRARLAAGGGGAQCRIWPRACPTPLTTANYRMRLSQRSAVAGSKTSGLGRRAGGAPRAAVARMGRTARCSSQDPTVQRAQKAIADACGGAASLSVLSARRLQSLWAGYGTVLEAQTDDEEHQQLIIKEIGACRGARTRTAPQTPQAGVPPLTRPAALTLLLVQPRRRAPACHTCAS